MDDKLIFGERLEDEEMMECPEENFDFEEDNDDLIDDQDDDYEEDFSEISDIEED